MKAHGNREILLEQPAKFQEINRDAWEITRILQMICVIKTDRDIFFISLFKSHRKLYSFQNTNYKSKLVKKHARIIFL